MSVSALVVVPTYNERGNLPTLISGLMKHDNVRVMVVDDQSPDGTGALADELSAQYPGRIEVMHRTGRRGLGRSYIDGLRKALAEPVDVLCQMDADLSHDPAHLPDLIAATAQARRRHRLAVHSGRCHRQLAETTAAAQSLCEHLHSSRDASERPRLHERVPLLATDHAGGPSARAVHL